MEYIFSHWVQAMRTFSSCLACTHIKMQRPTCRLNKLINAISYSSSPVWHLITHTSAMLECWREIFFLFFVSRISRGDQQTQYCDCQTHTHTSMQLHTDICTLACLSNAIWINWIWNTNASHFQLSKKSLFVEKTANKWRGTNSATARLETNNVWWQKACRLLVWATVPALLDISGPRFQWWQKKKWESE